MGEEDQLDEKGPGINWGLIGILVLLASVGIFFLAIPRCIVEGTPIDTPAGERPVEALLPGDTVWCRAPDGSRVEGWVTDRRVAPATDYLALGFDDGSVLRVTGAHPISTSNGWTPAEALRVGDTVHGRSGDLRLTRVDERDESVTVYDLSVSPHPNFFAAGVLVHNKTSRKHENEMSAIGALKTISSSQFLFRESDKERDGNLDYGTLSELANANLVDAVLGSGTKFGYAFEVTYGASTSEFIWYATARPLDQRVGDRYFATDHEGVTFYTTSAPFRMNSADCTVPTGVNPVGR